MEFACPRRDMFGKVKEGVHSTRIFGFAAFDTIGTIVLAYIFARLTGTSFLGMFIILMLLGLILHRVYCVESTLTKAVFGANFNDTQDQDAVVS